MACPAEEDTDTDTDQVLAAEREHLAKAREFLRLMRQDVLSLPALAGDRVSQEYLKADLHRRAESLRDLPDTPLFFGRLDYVRDPQPPERFHVGRRHVHDADGHPVVVDWRAPISRPFYRASQADPMHVARRRRFGFNGGRLTAYEDELFTAKRPGSEAEPAMSRIMIEEIERPRSGAMRDIVPRSSPSRMTLSGLTRPCRCAFRVLLALARPRSACTGWHSCSTPTGNA